MSIRDVLFRTIKGAPAGAIQERFLIYSGKIQPESVRIAVRPALFVESEQGRDWYAVACVTQGFTTLSNLGVDHKLETAGFARYLHSARTSTRSTFLGWACYATHGITSLIVSSKSWWAFFDRLVAACSASRK